MIYSDRQQLALKPYVNKVPGGPTYAILEQTFVATADPAAQGYVEHDAGGYHYSYEGIPTEYTYVPQTSQLFSPSLFYPFPFPADIMVTRTHIESGRTDKYGMRVNVVLDADGSIHGGTLSPSGFVVTVGEGDPQYEPADDPDFSSATR